MGAKAQGPAAGMHGGRVKSTTIERRGRRNTNRAKLIDFEIKESDFTARLFLRKTPSWDQLVGSGFAPANTSIRL